jgi:hypothetical protein
MDFSNPRLNSIYRLDAETGKEEMKLMKVKND